MGTGCSTRITHAILATRRPIGHPGLAAPNPMQPMHRMWQHGHRSMPALRGRTRDELDANGRRIQVVLRRVRV